MLPHGSQSVGVSGGGWSVSELERPWQCGPLSRSPVSPVLFIPTGHMGLGLPSEACSGTLGILELGQENL